MSNNYNSNSAPMIAPNSTNNNNNNHDNHPTPTTTTNTAPSTPKNANTTTIKVKIIYKDEIFAIKVPVTSTIEFLQGKIVDRLGFNVQLQYKDGERLIESAVTLGKLTVVAS
jgi:bud emergence protein 1